MGKNTLISEMLKFHFGNKIFCTNGQNGILSSVIFDASAKRMVALAVRLGRFFGKTVYVPFAKVDTATGEGIWLNVSLTELAAFPGEVGPGVSLTSHTAVKSSTRSGTLTMVAVQPESGTLAYIVVHNLLPGRSTLLQQSAVASLATESIGLSVSEGQLKALPPYRSDLDLQQEVDQIVFDLGFLHIDLKGMSLRVLDGVLFMDGNISSSLRGDLTRDQVSGVQGLLEVKNNLIGDDTLAAQIALALGQDQRTHDLPIGVYPQLGVVRLSGSVHNAPQKAAAAEIASQFEGVRSVINDLVIDPSAAMLYVMSAPEGGESKDITPGKFVRHTR